MKKSKLDEYIINEKDIGNGYMGDVVLADHYTFGKCVIKRIKHGKSQSQINVERFKLEAENLSKLKHQNIVQAYDTFTENGYRYIIMEFVEGTNLRELIKNCDIIEDQAIEILIQILTAMNYAHGKGIIHRDLKPENVMVSKNNIVKILDFGIALSLKYKRLTKPNKRLTRLLTTLGSQSYMSPEQRESPGSVTLQTDIYSIGLMFYELLTNTIIASSYDNLQHRKLCKRIKENTSIDVELKKIILKAIDKIPKNRYSSCSVFLDYLYAYKNNNHAFKKTFHFSAH